MDRRSRDSLCSALEREHVHDVYKRTAHHFEGNQYKAWPKVTQFLEDVEPGSVVADIGCGCGRHLSLNKDVIKIGSDRCPRLVEIARCHGYEVTVCDNLHLPYRDGCFDAVTSIGVIHHLTTPSRRAQALRELARVLRPGGRVMIYVWAMEQKHRKFQSQDVLVPWKLKARPAKREHDDLQRNAVLSLEFDKTFRAKRPTSLHNVGFVGPASKHASKMASQGAPSSRRHLKKDYWKNHQQNASGWLTDDDSPSGFSPDLQDGEEVRKSPQSSNIDVLASIPELIWSKFSQMFSAKSSPVQSGVPLLVDSSPESKLDQKTPSSATHKDLQYKQLIEQIMRDEMELFLLQKPLLEHSKSFPEAELEGFSVREFPQSSRPRELYRHVSADSAYVSEHDCTSVKSFGSSGPCPEAIVADAVDVIGSENLRHGKSHDLEANSDFLEGKINLSQNVTTAVNALYHSTEVDRENGRGYLNTEIALHKSIVKCPNAYLFSEEQHDVMSSGTQSDSGLEHSEDSSIQGSGISSSVFQRLGTQSQHGQRMVCSKNGENILLNDVDSTSGSSDSGAAVLNDLPGVSFKALEGPLMSSDGCSSAEMDEEDDEGDEESDQEDWLKMTARAIRVMQSQVQRSRKKRLRSKSTSRHSATAERAGRPDEIQPPQENYTHSSGISYPNMKQQNSLKPDTSSMHPVLLERKGGKTSVASEVSTDKCLNSRQETSGVTLENGTEVECASQALKSVKGPYHRRTSSVSSLSSVSSNGSDSSDLSDGIEDIAGCDSYDEMMDQPFADTAALGADIGPSLMDNSRQKTGSVLRPEQHSQSARGDTRQEPSTFGTDRFISNEASTWTQTENKAPSMGHSRELVESNDKGPRLLNGQYFNGAELDAEPRVHSGLHNQVPLTCDEDCVTDVPGAGKTASPGMTCRSPWGSSVRSEAETGDKFKRYYHVFREGELAELIDHHVGSLHILQQYYDHTNWCIIAEKKVHTCQ